MIVVIGSSPRRGDRNQARRALSKALSGPGCPQALRFAPMHAAPPPRPTWQRVLWLSAGALSLVLGLVGLALPVMPTVPFVLLAAFCFSRGCRRCEQWLLDHRHFGPPIRHWRERRAVSLRGKQFATVTMAGGAASAWWLLPSPWAYIPGACCAVVAIWLWWLPTAPADTEPAE
jgi:hypothetical protein